MITKLSSEALLIQVKMDSVWHEVQLLDEAIVRYIEAQGGEILSYRPFFDRNFINLSSKLKDIQVGVTQLLEDDK